MMSLMKRKMINLNLIWMLFIKKRNCKLWLIQMKICWLTTGECLHLWNLNLHLILKRLIASNQFIKMFVQVKWTQITVKIDSFKIINFNKTIWFHFLKAQFSNKKKKKKWGAAAKKEKAIKFFKKMKVLKTNSNCN